MPIKNTKQNLSQPLKSSTHVTWVRETRFGRWFLGTQVWYKYVLSQAVLDFKQLLKERVPLHSRILDAGCGQGLAFGLLEMHFQPSQIVGIDIDCDQVNRASRIAAELTTPAFAVHNNANNTPFESASFDMIFCHQLLHHTGQQTEVLNEFYRLLKPEGILLVGESCRSFINSVPVKVLFRHPSMAQKDADGYVDLVKAAGFTVAPNDIVTSRPWWSRRCLGLAQKCGIGKYNKPPTEVLIVAIKSAKPTHLMSG
jgi:SAM-dependent methyltransferase